MPDQEGTMDHIQDLLSDLANAKDDLHELAAPLEAQIEVLDRKLSDLTGYAQASVSRLEAEIRHETLLHGETVKGTRIWAVYNRGRVSWDDRALMGFVAISPEILPFRRQGKPYVSIRKASKR